MCDSAFRDIMLYNSRLVSSIYSVYAASQWALDDLQIPPQSDDITSKYRQTIADFIVELG